MNFLSLSRKERVLMKFDKRKGKDIQFMGGGKKLSMAPIENGDEAKLFHNGRLIIARITSIKQDQFTGVIINSPYAPSQYPEFAVGKEIAFLEEDISIISKAGR